VPLGQWVRDTFHLSRNHYDRLAHLVLGGASAIGSREVLLRWTPLRPGLWLFAVVSCACLALSAGWELLEWGLTIMNGEGQSTGLDTQDDVWDTHWDMFLALVGSLAAQLLLGRIQDVQLEGDQRGRSS
jgi:putative membrane protein